MASSTEMDAETAALIERLMLDDMDELNAAGSSNLNLPSGHQANQSWGGSNEAFWGDEEHQGLTEDDEWSDQPSQQLRVEEDVSNQELNDTNEISSSKQSSSDVKSENDELLDSDNNKDESSPEVVGGIVDPSDNLSVGPTHRNKGKGKAQEPLSEDEDEIDTLDKQTQEYGAKHSATQNEEDNFFSDEDEEEQESVNDSMDLDDQHPEVTEHSDDYLFHPCRRVWEPFLKKYELHVTIPWSFVAKTFGIVVEGDEGHRRGRGRGRKPWEQHSSSAEVVVHEIRLDQLDEDKADWMLASVH